MEYKSFPILTREFGDDRVVKHLFAIFGHVDDAGDRIMPRAFAKTLKERADRVRVLWQHNAAEPPIGVPLTLKEIGREELPMAILERWPDATGGLYGEVRYLDTPRANEVLAGIRAGAINENSIGFDPIRTDLTEMTEGEWKGQVVRNIREARLWDVSPVNWGMQEAARVVKAAVPYRDTGQAAEDTPWAAPTLGDFTDATFDELDAGERRRIMAHFAWSANVPPEAFADLKLPHHKPARSGVGPAVWRGVAASMAALMGARGGVDIPDADRRAVYEHLAKHYKEFNREPPEFRAVEARYHLGRAVQLHAGALKVGRVLSQRNLDRLSEALRLLQEVLSEAEPLEEEDLKALTLRINMQLAERELQLLSLDY